MTLLWLTLLFLHQGYTLVTVVKVEHGEPVTLTCPFTEEYQSQAWLYWYKQSAGDTLKIIVKQRNLINPTYGPEFSASRFIVTNSKKISNLTILRTVQQDEGMYHCAKMDLYRFNWTGTYLSIKGKSERTASYKVVQQPIVPYPGRPADSDTLQCSVLSASENTACSEDPSVFWFRAKSAKSFPDIIYTDGKRSESCEKRSDSQRRCVYNFSKNVSSSDPGTYYCAVATCGQILFANERNLKNDEKNEINVLVVTIICLVISVIGNIVFIYFRAQRSACEQLKESSSSQRKRNLGQKGDDAEDGSDLNYAALHFSEGRTSTGKKKRELMTEESVYSQVKGSV